MTPLPTNRRRLFIASALVAPGLVGCATRQTAISTAAAVSQVRKAEIAFAATMARRDLDGFRSYIADDAVFINGGKPLRGRSEIVKYWSGYFKDPKPPFTWQPAIVEVASSRTLGYTEGPVTAGETVIARFYSTWQFQDDGRWLVVFDNGHSECKR